MAISAHHPGKANPPGHGQPPAELQGGWAPQEPQAAPWPQLLWVPLPAWCRRCRSWRCPVPPGGCPARGRGPQTPRPWPHCRAGQRAPRAQCPPLAGSPAPASGSAPTAGAHLGGTGRAGNLGQEPVDSTVPWTPVWGSLGGLAGGRRAGSPFCPTSAGGPRAGGRAGRGAEYAHGPPPPADGGYMGSTQERDAAPRAQGGTGPSPTVLVSLPRSLPRPVSLLRSESLPSCGKG